MTIIDEIKQYLSQYGGTLTEDKGLYVFSYQIAERKTAVNKTSVSYKAKFRVLESEKLVKFTEIVKESSTGLGVGDEGIAPGVGFKKEHYKTGAEGREGQVIEKSTLGGKKLEYTINYKEIRSTIKNISEKNGYKFKYKIIPFGL